MPVSGSILDELELARTLYVSLGGYWSGVFPGRDQVERLCRSMTDTFMQVVDQVDDAVSCIHRESVPLRQRRRWARLTLKQSEMQRTLSTLRYGDGTADYGSPSTFYGEQRDLGLPSYPFPADASCDVIVSRMTSPGLVLVRGVDFAIETGRVVFLRDPLLNNAVALRPVFDGEGNVVDTEGQLWLFRPTYDINLVRDHVGFMVDASLPSTAQGREIANAILDGISGGTATAQLIRAVAAAVDSPVVLQDGEVVATIASDSAGQFVATGQQIYRCSPASTITVQVGDVLRAGDPLTDAFTLVELNTGNVPAWLQTLSLGDGLLADTVAGDITFPNRDVATTVTVDSDGYTRLEFPVGGTPAAVASFWRAFHARGREAVAAGGKTLAMLLDRRPVPVGQPTAASLPSSINPLAFLIQNILRANSAILRLRPASFGPAGVGIGALKSLRRIAPPHTYLFTVVELPVVSDSVIVDPNDDAGSTVTLSANAPPISDPVLSAADALTVPPTPAFFC